MFSLGVADHLTPSHPNPSILLCHTIPLHVFLCYRFSVVFLLLLTFNQLIRVSRHTFYMHFFGLLKINIPSFKSMVFLVDLTDQAK